MLPIVRLVALSAVLVSAVPLIILLLLLCLVASFFMAETGTKSEIKRATTQSRRLRLFCFGCRRCALQLLLLSKT
jgi:hypothetical protein